MRESLHALVARQKMGTLDYQQDRLTFRYADAWREAETSYPLSLSMPLAAPEHTDAVVRSFIWGLLPDNNEVLERWGKRYHVSARNPFRLLANVGEECAGAVQFVRPQRLDEWLSDDPPAGITWLDGDEITERIRILVADHSQARRLGDEGQFSLAGAQPKTGLYLDPDDHRWGIPHGTTPTTHILKPDIGAFDAYGLNEHFCLRLAARLALPTTRSWIEVIGDFPVIIVERFDRFKNAAGRILRVHQEDACQASGKPPTKKYQSDGGPSARDIFDLIRDHSSSPDHDKIHFLDAMIFNYLIGGTDAHSKNYGFLLASGHRVRLAPLYDVSSALPYPDQIRPMKAKLAMKIGGQYLHYRIGPNEWGKAAREWKLDRDLVFGRIVSQAEQIPEAAIGIAEEMNPSGEIIERLVEEISKSAENAARIFSAA